MISDFLHLALIDVNGIKGEVGNEKPAFRFVFFNDGHVPRLRRDSFVARRRATDVTLKRRFVPRMKTYEGTEAC